MLFYVTLYKLHLINQHIVKCTFSKSSQMAVTRFGRKATFWTEI